VIQAYLRFALLRSALRRYCVLALERYCVLALWRYCVLRFGVRALER